MKKIKAWAQTICMLADIRSLENSIKYWKKEQKIAADRQILCFKSLRIYQNKLYKVKGGQ